MGSPRQMLQDHTNHPDKCYKIVPPLPTYSTHRKRLPNSRIIQWSKKTKWRIGDNIFIIFIVSVRLVIYDNSWDELKCLISWRTSPRRDWAQFYIMNTLKEQYMNNLETIYEHIYSCCNNNHFVLFFIYIYISWDSED